MKHSIMKKWVKLLRSGEIKQGRFTLEDEQGAMCCLGVLCNIALVEGVCDVEAEAQPNLALRFDGVSDVLPGSVQQWARMQNETGYIKTQVKLTALNDNGKTFAEIADIIEKEWKNL